MTPTPVTVSSYPLFLNAQTLKYTARELRQSWDDAEMGPGVLDYDSFRVRQRAAGANLSVDCSTASALNRAYVRSTIQVNDSISASGDAGLYRQDYSNASPLNITIDTADITNPRIDQVFLCIEDVQATGANNQCTIRVVNGTPTPGATLDNRSGVGAAPAGMASILLADVNVTAGLGSVANANIRDRRPFTGLATIPPLGSTGTQVDQVAFVPAPGLVVTQPSMVAGTGDNTQAAVLMYLPRRIVNATRIRWKYNQGGTAVATNYIWSIFDASGRNIVSSSATAFTGALNTIQVRSETIAATTFEVGWYYVFFGLATMTASSSFQTTGIATTVQTGVGSTNVAPVNAPNLILNGGGGTTVPTTILALTDVNGRTGGTNATLVPVPTLSVG